MAIAQFVLTKKTVGIGLGAGTTTAMVGGYEFREGVCQVSDAENPFALSNARVVLTHHGCRPVENLGYRAAEALPTKNKIPSSFSQAHSYHQPFLQQIRKSLRQRAYILYPEIERLVEIYDELAALQNEALPEKNPTSPHPTPD